MHFLPNMNHNDERGYDRYRTKYKYLKRKIKSLLIENAALCDEVAKIQESIMIVKEERKYLLRKLLEHENNDGPNIFGKSHTPMNGTKAKKRKSPEHNSRKHSI